MPTYTMTPKVYIDVTSAFGDPATTWVEITQWCRDVEFSVSGRSRAVDDFQPGQGAVTLDNRDGRFDPSNTASPYYPDLGLRNRIKVTAYVLDGGSPYSEETISYGWVEAWPQGWRFRDLVDVRATWTDALGVLANANLPDSVWDYQISQRIAAGDVVAWYRWGDQSTQVADSSGNGLHGTYRVAQSYDDPTSSALAPLNVIKAGNGDALIPMVDRPTLNLGKMIAEAGQPAVNTLGGDVRYPCAVLSDATGRWGLGDFTAECWTTPRATFVVDSSGVNMVQQAPQWLFLWGMPSGASIGFGVGTDGKPGAGRALFGDLGLGYATWQHLGDTEAPATGSPPEIISDALPHHLAWAVTNNSGSASWDIELYVDGVSCATYSWGWADTAAPFGRPAVVGQQHSPSPRNFADSFDSTIALSPEWVTATGTDLTAAPGVRLTNDGSTYTLETGATFDLREHYLVGELTIDLESTGSLEFGSGNAAHFRFSYNGGVSTTTHVVTASATTQISPDVFAWTPGAPYWYRIRVEAGWLYFEVSPDGFGWRVLVQEKQPDDVDISTQTVRLHWVSPGGGLRPYSTLHYVEFGKSTRGVGAGSTIADLVVYNSVLSAADILANYRAGKYGDPAAAAVPDTYSAVVNAFGYLGFTAEGISTAFPPGDPHLVASGKLGGVGLIGYCRELARGDDAMFYADSAGSVNMYGEGWKRAGGLGGPVLFVLTDDGASYSSLASATVGISDISVSYDDANLINQALVSFDGGSRTVSDPTSISAHGVFQRQVSTMLTDATDAEHLGQLHISQNSEPFVAVDSVTFDGLSGSDAVNAAAFCAFIGYRVRVIRHRPVGSALDGEHWIQSVRHHIEPGNGLWTVTLGLVPADPAGTPAIVDTTLVGSTTQLVWY